MPKPARKLAAGPRVRPDGLININPTHADDPFYRYTMPPLKVQVVSAGTNGVKTLLHNLDAVADSLRRPAGMVLKYMSYDLGARHGDGAERRRTAWINGAWDNSQLQFTIDKFVGAFALCSSCGDPATGIRIAGGKKCKTVMLSCGACGAETAVNPKRKPDVKLSKHIISSPPQIHHARLAATAAPPAMDVGATSDPQLDDDFDFAAAHGFESDDDLATPPPEEVEARARDLAPSVAGMLHASKLPKVDRHGRFRAFLVERCTAASVLPPRETEAEAIRWSCGSDAAAILVDVALSPQGDEAMPSLIERHAETFRRFLENNREAQARALAAVESVVMADPVKRLPKAMRTLVMLHDKASVEADAILRWHAKVGQLNLIKTSVAPFVEWLAEGNDDDTDDDDDEAIVFATSAAAGAAAPAEPSEDEELDAFIDAI